MVFKSTPVIDFHSFITENDNKIKKNSLKNNLLMLDLRSRSVVNQQSSLREIVTSIENDMLS